MKQSIKIYLEQEDLKKLKEKAEESGFEGKGAVSHYIEKISKEPVIFADKNLKSALKLFAIK